MPDVAHGCGSVFAVFTHFSRTPGHSQSYFPGSPGLQQNRALSLQLKLRNKCFHSLKRKEKAIMHNVLSKTGDLPLALAVVPFVPLIALVCIGIIIALEWRMTNGINRKKEG